MNVSEQVVLAITIYLYGLPLAFMILDMATYKIKAYQVVFWPITLLKFLLKSLIQAILH